MQKILAQLAAEIRIRPDQVKTAVELLDGGATVPFIARYRKEVTGGLDDIQLRELETRLSYLRELADRLGTPAYMIDSAADLQPEWFEGRRRVGLTAGASAPEVLVNAIVDRLKALGAAGDEYAFRHQIVLEQGGGEGAR